MRILVVGGGGREHTICWALSRSATIFCAPGNPGTRDIGTNLPINPSDQDAVVAAVSENDRSKVLSGPDETLESHLMVFAAERARLEQTVVEMSSLA